jgi:hypothetical protein
MLFDTHQFDIRKKFYSVWEKYKTSQPLEPLEQHIVSTLLEHPEYRPILENPNKYLEKNFAGDTNPFLHFGLHLAIYDQVTLDQPAGVKAIYDTLCQTLSPHDTMHLMMEQLANQLAVMNHEGKIFDVNAYLNSLRILQSSG